MNTNKTFTIPYISYFKKYYENEPDAQEVI